jgi:hypothetical protein
MPLNVIVVSSNQFMFFHQTHHMVNVEVRDDLFNFGADVMLAAQPQFPHGAGKGNLVNATIGIE